MIAIAKLPNTVVASSHESKLTPMLHSSGARAAAAVRVRSG